MDLFKHNIKISFRNFSRHRSSFLINLLGLSSGLACVLLIYLWVADELAVNKYHEKADRLYQLLENVDQGGGVITRQTSAGPTAETLAKEFPEVEYAATATWISNYTLSAGNKNLNAKVIYASKDFFELFTFEFLSGNSKVMLQDINSVVISDELAMRLFGTTENLIGEQIEFEKRERFQITGVFKKLPSTSSLQYDCIFPFSWFWKDNEWVQNWYNTGPRTYLLFHENADRVAFNLKVKELIREKTEGNANHRSPFAVNYSEKYLYGKYENGVQSGGRIEYVRLFSAIAFFILLIACINFMNLSTARASRRLKEVGIKKTVGATRRVLIFQYLGESVLLVLISTLIAGLAVFALLPQFNLITDKDLALTFEMEILLVMGLVIIVTGLVAGSYPALYLSGFSPAKILKGKLNKSVGETWTRKGLVTFQFALSFVLIVSVVVVYRQIQFTQTKHLGYDQENVVFFDIKGAVADSARFLTFKSEVSNLPGVAAVTGCDHTMTGHNGGTYGIQWPGKDPDDRTEFERMFVTEEFIDLMDIEIVAGRSFSDELSTERDKILFNEAAIAFMGFEDPIGQKVQLWGSEVEIIGVVKDFHFESFHETIKPVFIKLADDWMDYLVVKAQAGQERLMLESVEELHREFNPGFDLDYHFLNEDYQRMYDAETRVSVLSRYFAGLAVIISCLGLFGLASFTLERKSKEIGIRKTLGSSNFSLVARLSSELTRMVVAAILIGLPISYFATSAWLENFAFRISLEWWFFVGAGLITMFIALGTVSFQAIKASTINPVRYLRDE